MTKILLVGCGKMGGALLRRIAGNLTVCVVDPSPPPAESSSPRMPLPSPPPCGEGQGGWRSAGCDVSGSGACSPSLKPPSLSLPAGGREQSCASFTPRSEPITWLASPEAIDPSFMPDVILLAVKPQHMAEVLPYYARFKDSVFLSIAAGLTLARLQSFLGDAPYAIVRAMPNLPASMGMGMSVAVANKNVTPTQHNLCDQLLKAVGETAWVEDEGWMDAVTALSGSGPAYVFALCESMSKAGESLGLPSALAEKLARQTVIGSGALLAQSSETAEALRKAVTSPGGTTEAALKHILAPQGLPDLMQKAMLAAAQRAKKLAG